MRQVEGIAHLGDKDEQVTPEVGRPSVTRRGARNQQHGSREAHDDAQCPPWRDTLVQQDRRQDECEDGHRRQLDGGIDGRGKTQAHDVTSLGQREAKEARPGNLRQVATLHPLLRHDERPQPEDDRRADDTERHQLRPRDAAACEHILGERRHQPEQHHRQQHRPMRPQVLVSSHYFIYCLSYTQFA